ncbi:10998_t:CDS:2, partial [Funneliformis geosporum]
EHGTEVLEHVFGLARQLIPDFTAYEFFKILRRVMYHNKILRTEDFSIKKEKVSATEYIFDLDSNDTSIELLELLRQWSTQDEIHRAVRITYVNAKKFAHLVALSNYETNLYPFIYIDNSHVKMKVEYVDDSTTNFNINQHKKLQLSNDDDLFNDKRLEQCKATLSSRVAEPEELLFDDDELDVLKALNIRESHNAFSKADRLCGIQIHSTVNLDEGSQNRIDRNIINELEMRKHAKSIRIPKTIS